MDDQGSIPGKGNKLFFATGSRHALGDIHPPIQCVTGSISLGIKRVGCETDQSSPSSTEVKNAWSYTSTRPYVFMERELVSHRDNFTSFALPETRRNSKLKGLSPAVDSYSAGH
jgi:hypothetical protein